MKYLYLLINLGSLIIPLLYSFEPRMNFIKYFKSVLFSTTIVAIPFIIWDIIFTDLGVWGFNNNYLLGFKIFNLPLEEVLFFFCIPYASIFTHYALHYFYKNLMLSKTTTNSITIVLIVLSTSVALFNFSKLYTSVNLLIFALLMFISMFLKRNHLNRFFISYILILLPFFIVNGILTGSFIENEVVWYNNLENLNIRLVTIPIEDIFYGFTLLYSGVLLIEYFNVKFKLNATKS